MRYGFIDAKRGYSLVLLSRGTQRTHKRLMIGALALTLMWLLV
jgi:hypothetical protein